MKRFAMLAGYIFTLILVTSCATTSHELKSGSSSLVVRVTPVPYEKWETARVYLNGQFVDTVVPGNDRKTYDLAPGKYDVKVITQGYETCEESVFLIEGRKQHYLEFQPKKVLPSQFRSAVERFVSP